MVLQVDEVEDVIKCHLHTGCDESEFCTLFNECWPMPMCRNGASRPDVYPIDGICPGIKGSAAADFGIAGAKLRGGGGGGSRTRSKRRQSHRAVSGVRVCASDICISAIAFEYYDGTVHSWGNMSLPWCSDDHSFAVPKGHYLSKITTRVGTLLSGLQLVTNKGTTSDWFGGWDGKHSQFKAKTGNEIWALQRGDGSCAPLRKVHERTIA